MLNAEEKPIDISNYLGVIDTMLLNINKIISNNGNSNNITNTYNVAEKALKENKIIFKIDLDNNKILSGMFFRYYDTGEINLVFGKTFLDTFQENKTIHYTILMHELRHLHDYLINREVFMNAKNDIKESYWYELDALRIEAEFIKYYLYGKYTLSAFEKYFLNSFENDYLDSISILMERESMETFYYFNKLTDEYIANNNKNSIINSIVENGYKNIELYNNKSDDRFNYFVKYIVLSTFRKYMLRLMVLIINDPVITWGEVFGQYPKIEDIYNQITEIQKKDNEIQSEYLSSIYEYWENDLMRNN
jgi:hypothetical protein